MQLRRWFRKNREFIIIVVIFLLFTVLAFVGYRYGEKLQQEKAEAKATEIIEQDAALTGEKIGTDSAEAAAAGSSTKGYYTRITPADILKKIQEYGDMDGVPESMQVELLPVGWFAYFFSVEPMEDGKQKIYFDTLESGFGATIICEVKSDAYPQFATMKSGKKVWIAGKLAKVVAQGTGTFTIIPEHFRFDGKRHTHIFAEKSAEE